MAISGINNVSSVNPYSPQSVSNINTSSRSVEPANVYGGDSVSILAKSAAQTSIFVSGGIAGYKYSQNMGDVGRSLGSSFKSGSTREIMDSVTNGSKTIFTSSANAAGVGALVSGGTSLISNAFSYMQGRSSAGTFTANVATDTIKGAVAGVGGALGGGLTNIGMGLIGFTGTPLVIAGVVGGVVGAALLGSTINTDSLRYKIRNAIG